MRICLIFSSNHFRKPLISHVQHSKPEASIARNELKIKVNEQKAVTYATLDCNNKNETEHLLKL